MRACGARAGADVLDNDTPTDAEEEARPAFFAGIVGAVVFALIGLLGPHAGSVWRMPQVLQTQAEAALERAGAGGLEVEMRGQRAVLRGVVADQNALAPAQRAVLTSAGAGGVWAGGVTMADMRGVAVGPVSRPFAWRIVKGEREVTLTGAAPSEAAKAALAARARQVFDNREIVDRMHVAGGAPSPAWRRIALDAIDQVARLERGEARINDGRLVIIGEGERNAVQAIRRRYTAPLPAPFLARAEVGVRGEPLAIAELQDLDLTDARPEVCAQAFQRLMQTNVINFESGSAELDRASLPLLDTLASVALRCDRFTIEVSGHTDNQGDRALNLDLSRRRAEAVVAYLTTLNVERERMRAVGYGPDRPVEANTTPQGQAANRRIVFSVSS